MLGYPWMQTLLMAVFTKLSSRCVYYFAHNIEALHYIRDSAHQS